MKEDIKNLWVAALRSEDYKQGKGRLRNGDEYCCLGVLCELLNISKQNLGNNYSYDYQHVFLPIRAMRMAGMKSDDGNYRKVMSLANQNDQGRSFKEIADIIETHWQKL